jgi:hypothetical protein
VIFSGLDLDRFRIVGLYEGLGISRRAHLRPGQPTLRVFLDVAQIDCFHIGFDPVKPVRVLVRLRLFDLCLFVHHDDLVALASEKHPFSNVPISDLVLPL